jgi:hypothetical protein
MHLLCSILLGFVEDLLIAGLLVSAVTLAVRGSQRPGKDDEDCEAGSAGPGLGGWKAYSTKSPLLDTQDSSSSSSDSGGSAACDSSSWTGSWRAKGLSCLRPGRPATANQDHL